MVGKYPSSHTVRNEIDVVSGPPIQTSDVECENLSQRASDRVAHHIEPSRIGSRVPEALHVVSKSGCPKTVVAKLKSFLILLIYASFNRGIKS